MKIDIKSAILIVTILLLGILIGVVGTRYLIVPKVLHNQIPHRLEKGNRLFKGLKLEKEERKQLRPFAEEFRKKNEDMQKRHQREIELFMDSLQLKAQEKLPQELYNKLELRIKELRTRKREAKQKMDERRKKMKENLKNRKKTE